MKLWLTLARIQKFCFVLLCLLGQLQDTHLLCWLTEAKQTVLDFAGLVAHLGNTTGLKLRKAKSKRHRETQGAT